MTMICYQPRKFSKGSQAIIAKANEIIAEYQAQGLSLTLRQVYYQFVSKGLIPNNQAEYKRLGSVLNDARMAGLVSWDAMEDRTRNIRGKQHWDDPAEFLRACARGYHEDLWASQNHYVEVWIEKDALVGVLEAVCPKNDVPYFSCRGYTSQSEMWEAAMRINRAARLGDRQPVIVHLGDHDPSGVDMSRDIKDRLNIFSTAKFDDPPKFDRAWEPREIEVRRIALTMKQVDHHKPPPNPAKMTDARAQGYVDLYGNESWELDALEPRTLIRLIQAEIDSCKNDDAWDEAEGRQEMNRAKINSAAKRMEGRPILEVMEYMVDEMRSSRRGLAKGKVAILDGKIELLKPLIAAEKELLDE